METAIIKKRLNTFKSGKGTLRDVSNDVVMEVLRGWEGWSGRTSDYYREIGLSKMQMVTMIQKAKKLVKSGAVTEGEFKELKLDSLVGGGGAISGGIEVIWTADRVIRFSQVDQLVDFVKKAT